MRAEGWKWIAVAADFPYGHTAGLRRLTGETVDLTDEERREPRRAARPNTTPSRQQYAEADELPDEVDQRLGEIETAMAAFEDRPVRYDPAEIARAGVFVSIDGEGALRIERGFVRPEDEAPVEPVARAATATTTAAAAGTERRRPAGRHHHRRRADQLRAGGAGGGRRPSVRFRIGW